MADSGIGKTLTIQYQARALAKYAESLGEPLGSQTLKDMRDRLVEQMNGGEGKTLVNSNVNGRAYSWQVNMTAEEQFAAVIQALEILTEDAGGPITFVDFSGINC